MEEKRCLNTGITKEKDNGRISGIQEDSKALVTLDGEGVDWTSHSEDEQENYAFMACNSSGSDTEVTSCSKEFCPPMTGIYIPSRPDKEINDSQFSYGPKQSKPSESDARSSDFNSCESNCSEETHESMPEPVVNEPKVDYPHRALQNKGIVDSGCSRHMTGNKAYLAEYQDFNGGPVAFGGRIKREYSNAITPQQNGIAERKNMTLIEAARTMLADSFLPNTFWAEAVSTACYVLNRVLVTKTQNKTPYELITGKIPIISYIRPFGCHVTILNTIDHLGKFDRNSDDGFLVGYSLQSKAFKPVRSENQAKQTLQGPQELFIFAGEEPNKHPDLKTDEKPIDKEDQVFLDELERLKRQEKDTNDAAEAPIRMVDIFTDITITDQMIHEIPALVKFMNPTDGIFTYASYDDEGAVADFTNLETVVNFKQEAKVYIACFLSLNETQEKFSEALDTMKVGLCYDRKNAYAIQDSKKGFWILIDLPYGKKAIGTKWVYKNKKDERGVVVRNKARIFLAFASYMGFIVYQMDVKSAFLYGKIDEEVYVSQPPAWYATLSTFLLKSGYRRGTIDKTLFIKKDKNDIMLVQVYVDDIIFGSTKRSWCDEFEALMKSRFQMSSMGELTFFLGLQVKQKEDGIFISQDKYVAEILKKFDFASVKTASTPVETQKPLVKDEEAADVDVHLYRSMIGSLMYLTASRPDIMFAVCACSRFQVTPKTSHLNAVKRIFRYLKGKPKLGLWYPRVSSFDLEAYSDSDYAGANLDRKSTTGGCQFLGRRLISWQCKKQTIVATSTTEAEYVAAANCCGQVLWIQNQMLDYGFNFMNTKIYIDNESTICIVKNPVFHSKTKHIEIRHHFIRDAYEKKLIQVLKIHTDDNVADLLTKAFDVSRSILTISDEVHGVCWVFQESLGRDKDGIEALLLPNLFTLALTIVSTDSAKLVPLGKDSTAIETLKKIPPRV
ncbi:putative ribonuclease H-like domain-containing protein [Tanacetum coccineum]